jgi:hypothetical protein
MSSPFTQKEKEEIRKIFGQSLEDLTAEDFRKVLKDLRLKYHPGNFEKCEDETVKKMATERFQNIEALAGKTEEHFTSTRLAVIPEDMNGGCYTAKGAVFAAKRMRIEIMTSGKDLKYRLFGTYYRWLELGDSYKIPGTHASIVTDENYAGRKIGFQESVKMYLTFDENESIENIAGWLFSRIEHQTNTLLISGNLTKVELQQIITAIKKESFLRIGSAGTA